MKRVWWYTTLALLVSAVGAHAQEEQPQILNSVLLSQVKITVVKSRFTDKIRGLVKNSPGAIEAPDDMRILVLTLKVEKPRGQRFELHQCDFDLGYRDPDPEDEDWDDRSHAAAIRIIGQSLDDDPHVWLISSTGYAAQHAPDLARATEVYVELGFVLEKPVSEAYLLVAQPVKFLQLQNQHAGRTAL